MLMIEPTDRLTEEVTITLEEYTDLLREAEKWHEIRSCIWNNTVCTTSALTKNPVLSLEGYRILDAMAVIDRQKYREALNGRTDKD